MARRRLKRPGIGLFDVPDRSADDDEKSVLGGPDGNTGLFGRPDYKGGLFDTPDGAPVAMPGLFELRRRPRREGTGLPDKPARRPGGGLFDKPDPSN